MIDERYILVVAHARRDDTVEAAQRVLDALSSAGARPVVTADDRAELIAALGVYMLLRR